LLKRLNRWVNSGIEFSKPKTPKKEETENLEEITTQIKKMKTIAN